MERGASVAPYSIVVAFDSPVRTVGRLWVSQDVLPYGIFDEVVDGVKDTLRPFRRVVDVVVHVVFLEVDSVKGNENSPGFVGAAFQFCAEETGFVSISALVYLAYNRVGYEYSLPLRIFFKDVREFVRLTLGVFFQLLDVVSGHVLTCHNHDNLRVWQYRGVIVNVVCHMTYLGTRDDIKSGTVCIGCAPKDGGRKEEEALFSFLLFRLFLVIFGPFRALSVLVPFVATATMERLTPVSEVPVLGGFTIVGRPNLLPIDVLFTDLDEDLALTVIYVRAAVFSALSWLYNDGP